MPRYTNTASVRSYNPQMWQGTYGHFGAQFGITAGEEIGIREPWGWDPFFLPVAHQGILGGRTGGLFGTGVSIPVLGQVGASGRRPSEPTERQESDRTTAPPEGSIYEDWDTEPTDWDQVYADFVDLNRGEITTPDPYEPDRQQPISIGVDMPDIWDIGRGLIDIFDDDAIPGTVQPHTFAPGVPASAGGTMPQTVTVNTRTGAVTPGCKRRRRRRLLTESDFNDLMRISTLPNKENVRISLAKAIGRSR